MAFFKIEPSNTLTEINSQSFQSLGLRERQNLQALLRNCAAAIDPEMRIVAEEFSNWQDAGRRVDLLGLDKNTNLVVIELKVVEEGGHMELQALRYAAMLSTVDFAQVVEAYAKLLRELGQTGDDAQQQLLDFLEVGSANDVVISSSPRIVLVAPSFSREITTTVLWLNERGLDIRCLAIAPYNIAGQLFLEIEQVIPLPAATDYIVRKREKEVKIEKQAVTKQRRGRSLRALLEAGSIKPGDTLQLLKLPHNVHLKVPEQYRLAELLPGERVKWSGDGNTYSITELCAVICREYAPELFPANYAFAGPDYWALEDTAMALSDLARQLPSHAE